MKKLLSLLLCAMITLIPFAMAEESSVSNTAFWDHLIDTVKPYDWRTQGLTVDFGGAMFSYQPGEELMELSAHLDADEYAVQIGQEAIWLKLGDEETVLEIPYSAFTGMMPTWMDDLSFEGMDTEAFQQMGMMFVTIVLTPGIQMTQGEGGFHIHYERTYAGFLEDVAAFGDAVTSVERYAEALGALIDQIGYNSGMTGREIVEDYWPHLRETLMKGTELADVSVIADIDVGSQVEINAVIEAGADRYTIEASIAGNEDRTSYVLTLVMKDDAQTGFKLDAALDIAGSTLSGMVSAAETDAEIASFSASMTESSLTGNVWTPEGWAANLYMGMDETSFEATFVTSINEEPDFAVLFNGYNDSEKGTGLSAYLLCDGNEWGAALDSSEEITAVAYWPGGNLNGELNGETGAVINYVDEETTANSFTIVWDGETVTFSDGARNIVLSCEAQSDNLMVLTAAYSGEGVEDGEYEMFLEITEQENGWVLSLSDAQAAYAVISCAQADIMPLSQMDPVVLTAEDVLALLRSFDQTM